MVDLKVEVVSFNNLDKNEWNSFISETQSSTFFSTSDWWAAFDNSFFLIIRDNNGEIVSGVPFRLTSVLPLIGRFFRFCWTDSSLLVRKGIIEQQTLDIQTFTLEALIEIVKHKAIAVIFSSKLRSTDGHILQRLNFNQEKCATLILDLSKDEDDIFKSFSKGHRNSIRRAQKAGVQVCIKEGVSAIPLIEDYCILQRKMFESKADCYSDIYHKSEPYLRTILEAKYNRVFMAIAYYNGQPASGGLLVSFKSELYYYLAASDPNITRISHASNYLEFEIIKYAKAKGFTTLDTGNIPFDPNPDNPDYGTYLFKKGFGGVRFEYDHGNLILNKSRYMCVWRLRKWENNRTLRFMYKLLVKK